MYMHICAIILPCKSDQGHSDWSWYHGIANIGIWYVYLLHNIVMPCLFLCFLFCFLLKTSYPNMQRTTSSSSPNRVRVVTLGFQKCQLSAFLLCCELAYGCRTYRTPWHHIFSGHCLAFLQISWTQSTCSRMLAIHPCYFPATQLLLVVYPCHFPANHPAILGSIAARSLRWSMERCWPPFCRRMVHFRPRPHLRNLRCDLEIVQLLWG